jgi:hypothetical protein
MAGWAADGERLGLARADHRGGLHDALRLLHAAVPAERRGEHHRRCALREVCPPHLALGGLTDLAEAE